MIKKLILLSLVVTIISCVENGSKKKNETEIENYVNGISSSHKALVRIALEEDIDLKESNIPTKNSILVVEKSNDKILPYTNINSILKDRGYNISYKSNKLDYIIAIKYKWIKSGTYSGGREAHDCKTLIYAIDTKTDKINLVKSKTILAPDKVNVRPRKDGYYGGIKYGGYKLADLIISNVLKQ